MEFYIESDRSNIEFLEVYILLFRLLHTSKYFYIEIYRNVQKCTEVYTSTQTSVYFRKEACRILYRSK